MRIICTSIFPTHLVLSKAKSTQKIASDALFVLATIG